MASLSATNYGKFAFLSSILFVSAFAIYTSSFQFRVGGARGWVEPTGNETETYNDWAMMNRFHVGDTIYFKYQNDSVLEVSKKDYQNCAITKPISRFDNGSTVFRFGRYGFFYFISGQPDHCSSGQKMIVRVMVHPEVHSPKAAATAASPRAAVGNPIGPNSDDRWKSNNLGAPSENSTIKLYVASYVMIALGGVLSILHLFM